MKVLWIDGFFFGLVAGELLCLMFMQRYSALPSYLVVLGTLFLLTTVPVGIVEFVLTE